MRIFLEARVTEKNRVRCGLSRAPSSRDVGVDLSDVREDEPNRRLDVRM